MNRLEALLCEGMDKVASVIETNPSYDYILGERIMREEYERLARDAEGNLSDREELVQLFRAKLEAAKPAVYDVPDSDLNSGALCFANTANNRREISFLETQLAEEGLSNTVVNLCDYSYTRPEIEQEALRSALVAAFLHFIDSRERIKRGLLHQVISFGSFVLAAYEVLQRAGETTFVVANDHSPGPVAYTKVAQYFRMKTVYLQHAEVTSNFPPLDFNFSILRNRTSKRIYEDLGPISGRVLVASRDPRSLTLRQIHSAREALRDEPKLPALIYPSSVSNLDDMEALYRQLEANPRVSAVAVKLHPSVRKVEDYHRRDMHVRRATPPGGHLAICGNSSVAIELLAAGNLVFQCFELDEITADYYGFVRNGLTQEVRLAEAGRPFWTGDDGDFSSLGDYLPNLRTAANTAEAVKKHRFFIEAFGELSQKSTNLRRLRDRENLLRDVYCLTNSLVDYARTTENLYGDDFWVIRTLDAAFARRDVELGNVYARVDSENAHSVLEFWLSAKAIEWSGRIPSANGLDRLARFVRTYSSNARAKAWMENKLFDIFVRFGAPDDVVRLFATAEHLSPDALSANKKVAFVRFTQQHPEWQDRLRQIFDPAAAQLTPLERLKLSVQCHWTIDGELEYDDFRQVEREFVLRHPHLGPEYEENVSAVYRGLGGRAAFIDVKRNQAQRSTLLETLKGKLRAQEGYSFVRLSDGEGLIFQEHSDFFSDDDARNRQRHWWGEEIPQALLAELLSDLKIAVTDADLLGIPNIYRFLRDHSDRTTSLSQALQGRGLLSVLHGLPHYDSPTKRYTDDKANIALFNDLSVIEDLLTAAQKLIVVSSGAPRAVSRVFEGYGGVVHISIPTHNKTQHNAKYVSVDRPLPYVYRGINDQLEEVVCPGDLVLVGAGVAGKTFVRTARQRGAVGLDIGSAMDQLLDAGIHSLF